MKTLTLERLYCDAVDVKPRDFDFGSGFAETWETVFPDVDAWTEKQACDWLSDNGYDAKGEPKDQAKEAMMESESYAPMMNYIYPLPDFRHEPAKAQELIEDTNCVIVLIKDDCDDYCETPYLALSGGGMDLSWDICEAYMLLGYFPPVHFCQLPQFAGKKLTEKAQWIIDGCKESCKIVGNFAKAKASDLERLEQNMKQ